MDRTWAAELIPGAFTGDEAEPVEDISQGNAGPYFGEVDTRHGGSPRRNHQGLSGSAKFGVGVTLVGTEKRNP